MEQILKDHKEMLLRELDKMNKKGSINPSELECAYKAVCTLEKIKIIEAMDENRDDYSGRSYGYHPHHMDGWPMSYGGRDWEMDSQRRGRAADGRFVSRGYDDSQRQGRYGMGNDGRSGHMSPTREKMIERLERMRDEAKDERERQEIQMEIDRFRYEG